MSDMCLKCFKPMNACLCKYTKEFDPGIKFVLLMHPKEAKKQRTGTGRIVQISIKDSEILVGLDFSKNQRLQELLHDSKYFPLLLYPGEDAWNAKKEGLKEAMGDKIPLVIILDATWFCAKKLITLNPWLLDLPKFSFYGDYRSIFTFKKEPEPNYISTLESCYYLIKEFQSVDLVDKNVDPYPMMNAFKKMILFQLQAENERVLGLRPDTHPYDNKYKKVKEVPDFGEIKVYK